MNKRGPDTVGTPLSLCRTKKERRPETGRPSAIKTMKTFRCLKCGLEVVVESEAEDAEVGVDGLGGGVGKQTEVVGHIGVDKHIVIQ